jgi:hypothetical protein
MRAAKRHFLRMLAAPGMLNAIHQALTIGELCLLLETLLGEVFLDESGYTGSYAIDVEAASGDGREFLDGLCEELGLVVTPARREVELLIVRRQGN